MTSGVGVPAAVGIVKVQKDKDNGNMKLEIKVNHLARPSSLTPSANNYLVWIRPNGGDALKQGAIGVDKNLSGELTVETVAKDFDLLTYRRTKQQRDRPIEHRGPAHTREHGLNQRRALTRDRQSKSESVPCWAKQRP